MKPRGPRWTDEQILECLRGWVRFHGRMPTGRDLDRPPRAVKRHHPTYQTIRVRFGSLQAAFEAAGLDWTPPPRWTRESIIEAIQEWARTHDGLGPRHRDWAKATATTPSSETVRAHFGSLAAARRAAGVVALRCNMQNLTRDDVIAAIYRFRFLHGRLPTSSEWGWSNGEWPRRSTVVRLFGTWNSAIVAAGYTPRHARTTPHGYRAFSAAVTKRAA